MSAENRIPSPFSEEELRLIKEKRYAPFKVLVISKPDELAVLRATSEPIDADVNSPDFKRFIRRLKSTLEKEQGVGLAAPQVGILKRVFLFMRLDKEGEPIEVAVNPEIKNHPQETICFENDGCLSIPGKNGDTARYPWIDVEYTNECGERVSERLEGHSRNGNFTGIIFQHEFDHLNGILYTDRLVEKE